MSKIFQNKSYWENMDDISLNNYIREIFLYYRDLGFPYYNLMFGEKLKEYKQAEEYLSKRSLIDGNYIKQSMHLLGTAWSYFPHSFNVQCSNKRTPMDVFNDDQLFMDAIRKRLKHGTYITDSGIRKILRTYSNTQSVSNFRPTAAAAIYNHFLTDNESVVWDMSGGWGGRMLGASLSKKVHHYIYTEPASDTYNGLLELSNTLSVINNKTTYEGYRMGSEDFRVYENHYDLCFTSPPYFNLEKYTNEENQSWVKYSTIDMWCEKFLKKTIENCYYGLKKDRYMIINIADPSRGGFSLVSKTIKLAIESGFIYIDEYKLLLSNLNKGSFKYEPTLIFKKT